MFGKKMILLLLCLALLLTGCGAAVSNDTAIDFGTHHDAYIITYNRSQRIRALVTDNHAPITTAIVPHPMAIHNDSTRKMRNPKSIANHILSDVHPIPQACSTPSKTAECVYQPPKNT